MFFRNLRTLVVAFLLLMICQVAVAKTVSHEEKQFKKLSKYLLKNPQKPESLLKLKELKSLSSYIDKPERIFKVCKKLSKKKSTAFELRIAANWCNWTKAYTSGDAEQIALAVKKLGLMNRWMSIGPFDNEGGEGIDVIYAPERELDPDAVYEGKERDVSWWLFPKVSHINGYHNFRDIYTPYTQVLAYAYGRVYSKKKQKAVLLLAAGGEMKVWQNNKLVATLEGERSYKQNGNYQQAIKIVLKKGVNEFLLKVGTKQKMWGFTAALLDNKGRAISGLAGLKYGEKSDKLAGFPEGRVEWLLDPGISVKQKELVTVKLERLFKKKPTAKTAILLSRLHKRQHDYSIESKKHEEWADKALELAPDDKQVLKLCATIFGDHNKRFNCIRHALELDKNDAYFLLKLARFYKIEGQTLEARNILMEIYRKPKVEIRATLMLNRLLASRGWSVRALELLRALDKKYKGVRKIKMALIYRLNYLSMKDEAFKIRQQVFAKNPGNLDMLGWMASYYEQQKDTDQTLPYLHKQLVLDPGNISTYRQIAKLLEGQEKYAEALLAYKQALEFSPEDNGLLISLANLENFLGHRDKALLLWNKALQIHPQNPELKEYLRYLKPEKQSFETEYLMDASAVIEAYPPLENHDEIAETLLNLSVYKVFDNGLSSRFSQSIVRVYDKNGADKYNYFYIPYSPHRQSIKILEARIFKPDGRILENYQERENSLSQFKIYYDRRAKIIHFPDLEPGDVVELQYRMDDTASKNMFADYFGTLSLIQSRLPTREWRLVALMPKGRKLYSNKPRLIENGSVRTEDNITEYIWQALDVPKVVSESNAPAFIELADHLHISTFKDWETMGKWYWGLVKSQFVAKDDLKQLAQSLIKDVDDPLERIRIIYDWVVLNTRYVGLEFGIHSFKPYQVNQIFKRRFGDCKDKATLMITMLKEAGIKAKMAIIRTSNIGRIQDYPPSLSMFNHAIVYIPKYKMYLDGTAEFSGMRELPYQDSRGQVMLISETGVEYTTAPAMNPVESVSKDEVLITLSDTLDAFMEGSSIITGSSASKFRRHFQDKKRQAEMLEKLINRDFPGAKLLSSEFNDLTDIEIPVEFKYEVRIPSYLRKDGNGFAMTANIQKVDLAKQYGAISKRKHPVEIPKLETAIWHTSFNLDNYYKVIELPNSVSFVTDFATFNMDISQTGDRIDVKSKLVFLTNRIELDRYQEFRTFCQEVTKAFKQEIRINYVEK